MEQRRQDPSAGRWVRKGAAVFVTVAVMAAGTLVGATAAGAAQVVTVTPDTNLRPGDVVSVSGSGYENYVQVAQCVVPTVNPNSDCAYTISFNVDDGGTTFTQMYTVRRVIPFSGGRFDCGASVGACAIGVAHCVDTFCNSGEVLYDQFHPISFVRRIMPRVAAVAEGDAGTVNVEVPVDLSYASDIAVSVQWTTGFVPGAPAGQADPGTDYIPASGIQTLTFAPGETTKTAVIEVIGDVQVEPDEYIVTLFGNPTNADMGGLWGLGFGGITNDDVTRRVVPGAGTTTEGDTGLHDVTIPVTLSAASPATVTVQWRTVPVPGAPDFQADPTTDYVPATGTVTFTPGQTEQSVVVSVAGDTTVEHDEYFVVQMGNATNAVMGGFWGLGFGSITNDDP